MTQDPQQPVLVFPCDFPIKTFGLNNEAFEIEVLSIIRTTVPDIAETAITTRPSKDGKYLAVTVLVHVESKEQLDTIYRNLSANPKILMAL